MFYCFLFTVPKGGYRRIAATMYAAFLTLAMSTVPAHALDSKGVHRDFSMESGGHQRSCRLYLPSKYDPSKPLPLVVALHGGFGVGRSMERTTGFDLLADSARFIVAYPDGFRRSWNAGDKCCDPARKNRIDDVGFMRDLVAKIKAEYNIDGHRVYGAGFSNGAMLLLYVACQAPDIFSAIAVNAGGLMSSTCNGGRVPTLLIHGIEDPRIPYGGGEYRPGGMGKPIHQKPFPELAKSIARRNGCSDAERIVYDSDPATCKTYAGCGANEVTWCGIKGGGHQWFGGKTMMPRRQGGNTTRFISTRMIWKFFSRHRRGQTEDSSPPALVAPPAASAPKAGAAGK